MFINHGTRIFDCVSGRIGRYAPERLGAVSIWNQAGGDWPGSPPRVNPAAATRVGVSDSPRWCRKAPQIAQHPGKIPPNSPALLSPD